MRTIGFVVALICVADVAAAAPRPRREVAVTIASSSDESPGVLDAHARQVHRDIVRSALLDVLRRSGADVRHAGIAPRQLDAAIVSWKVTRTQSQIDVGVELRIVVADDRGRMISIVTGRAKISAPRTASLVELRSEVLGEAVRGMTRSLQSQLARTVS